MSGLIWVFIVGVTGWLTGKIIGGRGYGENLAGNSTDWLDIILGVTGASVAGFVFSTSITGEGGSFIQYGAAALGSISLVWVARLISTKYILSSVR